MGGCGWMGQGWVGGGLGEGTAVPWRVAARCEPIMSLQAGLVSLVANCLAVPLGRCFSPVDSYEKALQIELKCQRQGPGLPAGRVCCCNPLTVCTVWQEGVQTCQAPKPWSTHCLRCSWQEEVVVCRAPGRLDVMGGIADYSGSLVLQVTHVIAIFVGHSQLSVSCDCCQSQQ